MKAKIGVLFLVLMVGMAAVGASYALWSKTITLTGTVATGAVGMEWSPFTTNDELGPDPYWGIGDNSEGKDVASCTVAVDPNDPTKILVTIDNAYPYYSCTVTGDVTNTGTIPIKVYFDENLIAPGLDIVTTGGFALDGTQVHPTEDIVGGYQINVRQDAEQGATLTFGVTVEGRQWNEPRVV